MNFVGTLQAVILSDKPDPQLAFITLDIALIADSRMRYSMPFNGFDIAIFLLDFGDTG